MDGTRLPVVVVAGLHRDERHAAVQELTAGAVDAVVLRHDLRDASQGLVHRELRDAGGAFDTDSVPLVNDCACCALREDLLPRLLALADEGRYGLAVVELWGGSDPHPAVEVLAVDREVAGATSRSRSAGRGSPPCPTRPGTSTRRPGAPPPPSTGSLPQPSAGGTPITATGCSSSFTAEGLDVDGITGLLDSCLVTDAELAAGEPGWKALPDAFQDLLDPVH